MRPPHFGHFAADTQSVIATALLHDLPPAAGAEVPAVFLRAVGLEVLNVAAPVAHPGVMRWVNTGINCLFVHSVLSSHVHIAVPAVHIVAKPLAPDLTQTMAAILAIIARLTLHFFVCVRPAVSHAVH